MEYTLSEQELQRFWHERRFEDEGLCTTDGCSVRVFSPGWWNHGEGPDFIGAQVEVGGRLRTGDVEIHLKHAAWKQHGHHLDPRYDEVILVVVLETGPPREAPQTRLGKTISTATLGPWFDGFLDTETQHRPADPTATSGACAELLRDYGPDRMLPLLHLAGEWRMLHKARIIQERSERVGFEQAVYEAFMTACGFSRFKHCFRVLAQELPYDRARQLVREDPFLLEAAFFKLAGLFPKTSEDGLKEVPHFVQLAGLAQERLSGLKPIALNWDRIEVRPSNYPERRLAGAVQFLARTAAEGLANTLDRVWIGASNPLARRRVFEGLFPAGLGFWAEHCTWTGRRLPRPSSPLGADRARSVIGNVFVPGAVARARLSKDREYEEKVLCFYAALPKENGNRVLKDMTARVFGLVSGPKLDFRSQQGLLQVFQDWCELNTSCRNCGVPIFLKSAERR